MKGTYDKQTPNKNIFIINGFREARVEVVAIK